MSKARDSIEDLKTIDANFAAKAPLASPTFTGPLTSESAAATNIVAKSTNGNGGYMNFQGLASNGTQTFGVNHNGTIFTTSGLAVGGVGANNTLDDYEEGTFTPSGTGVNTSSSVGIYRKIGSVCHVQMWIEANGTTAGHLGGLPFASGLGSANYLGVGSTYCFGGNVKAIMQTTGVGFYMYAVNGAVGVLNSGNQLHIGLTYITT